MKPQPRNAIRKGVKDEPVYDRGTLSLEERLFTALALIAIDASLYDEMEASLRSDLAKDSFALWPHLQADILDVLRGTGRPDAAALAEAWEPFYRHVRP
jgi:hypothetical protein